MPRQDSSARNVSRIELWAARLDRMPRGARVAISLVITLVLVVLAWLVITLVLGVEILDPDPHLEVPLIVVIALGIVFYVIGWWALVGFDLDPQRPWHAGTAAVLYAAAGAASLVLVIMLALFGLAFGYIL